MSLPPVAIGPGNALAATGKPWSWWRRHAAELGIPLVTIGTTRLARAADVLAALDRMAPKAEPAPVDELAVFRERIARAG